MQETRLFAHRPLFYGAAAYGTGLLLGAQFSLPGGMVLAVTLVFLAGGILLRRRKSGLWMMLMSLFFAAVYAIGLALTPVLPVVDLSRSDTLVEGRVSDVSAREDGALYLLEDVTVAGQQVSGGVLLASAERDYALSDIIRAHASIRLPERAAAPGDYDDARYCASKGAVLRAYSVADEKVGHSRDLLSFAHGARMSLSAALDELFGPNAPTAKAFLLGVTWDMEAEVDDAFARSGLSHLLSVSGLHVMVMAGAVLWFLKLCKASRRVRFILITLFLCAFAVLTGLRSPVLRASGMFFMWQLAELLGRRSDGPTTLAAVFLAALVARPAAIFDMGFQLSYGAVFSISCLAGPLGRMLPARPKTLWEVASVNLAVNLGTLPLLIRMTNSFWLPGLVINLVAVPYASVAIPAVAVLALVGGLIPPLAQLAGGAGGALIALLERMAGLSDRADQLALTVPSVWSIAIPALFVLMFFCSDYCRGGSKVRLTAAICCAALVAGGYLMPLLHRGEIKVQVLDAGGNAVLILLEDGSEALVGTGSSGRTADYLKSRGIIPEYTFLTDDGRATAGGMEALAVAGRTGQVYAPDGRARAYSEKFAVPVNGCVTGDTVTLSERCSAQVVYAAAMRKDLEDSQMALLLTVDGKAELLFLGDMAGEYGERIAANAGQAPVVHTGSDEQSLPGGLAAKLDAAVWLSSGETAPTTGQGLKAFSVYDRGRITLLKQDNGWKVETLYASDTVFERDR
ncbi:MAG: ComEC/Rec2 family competence protein [Christensenellaceae bacterium]|nr:ComEC/Rec2 family competence protein [Christensenellaceae bacterium]